MQQRCTMFIHSNQMRSTQHRRSRCKPKIKKAHEKVRSREREKKKERKNEERERMKKWRKRKRSDNVSVHKTRRIWSFMSSGFLLWMTQILLCGWDPGTAGKSYNNLVKMKEKAIVMHSLSQSFLILLAPSSSLVPRHSWYLNPIRNITKLYRIIEGITLKMGDQLTINITNQCVNSISSLSTAKSLDL